MEFCGIHKFEDLIGQQNKIITYLMSLREKKLSFNSISTRLNAIYHFYDINDISPFASKDSLIPRYKEIKITLPIMSNIIFDGSVTTSNTL